MREQLRTFLDTNVLIAAAKGEEPFAARAFAFLDDPERVFVSSDFVKLELLPKPIYNKKHDEVAFYERFLGNVAENVVTSHRLFDNAFSLAKELGLSAIDAIHLAAAREGSASEFVTKEKPTKPLFRCKEIKLTSIHVPTGNEP